MADPAAKAPTNIGKHLELRRGDIDAGFAEADIVVEREFETSMAHQGYLEPHNGTAMWNEDGELTVWNSSQGPFVVREQLHVLLDLPLSKVKVVPMEIGWRLRRQDSRLHGADGRDPLEEDRPAGPR